MFRPHILKLLSQCHVLSTWLQFSVRTSEKLECFCIETYHFPTNTHELCNQEQQKSNVCEQLNVCNLMHVTIINSIKHFLCAARAPHLDVKWPHPQMILIGAKTSHYSTWRVGGEIISVHLILRDRMVLIQVFKIIALTLVHPTSWLVTASWNSTYLSRYLVSAVLASLQCLRT